MMRAPFTMRRMPLAAVLLHVALTIPPGTLPPAVLAVAVDEAAAIWAPYGVAVDVLTACEMPADDIEFLAVHVEHDADRAQTPPAGQPLGAIHFDDAGVPAPVISVFLGDLVRFISRVKVLGADDSRWPALLRDRVVGRVVGRVIAHEIGHYLLRTPLHSPSGLMRATHSADDFASPARRGFGLSRADAARVARAGGEHEGPARAGPLTATVVKR
jgi:hypothetical protein